MAKKTKAKPKKSKKDKEEVCEIFEVEKKGKEKITKACDLVEKKHATTADLKAQDITLRNILIGLIVVVALIIFAMYSINSAGEFTYRGVDWKMVKQGKLIFFQTTYDLWLKDYTLHYNMYLRNHPEQLEERVPFDGEIFRKRDLFVFEDKMARVIVHSEGDFDCDDDGTIALANVNQILEFFVMKRVIDPNATCDEEGRYVFLDIKEAEESSVEQIGKSCYQLNVANCEILDVTERFLTEVITEYNTYLAK